MRYFCRWEIWSNDGGSSYKSWTGTDYSGYVANTIDFNAMGSMCIKGIFGYADAGGIMGIGFYYGVYDYGQYRQPFSTMASVPGD